MTYTVCLAWASSCEEVPFPLPCGDDQLICCQTQTVTAGDYWPVGTERVTESSWTPALGSVPEGKHCLVAWVDTREDGVLETTSSKWDDNRASR